VFRIKTHTLKSHPKITNSKKLIKGGMNNPNNIPIMVFSNLFKSTPFSKAKEKITPGTETSKAIKIIENNSINKKPPPQAQF
jgi:hypothetical protein